MQSLVDASRAGRLDGDAVFQLATVLARSGHQLTWDNGAPTADLASTGGPSSLSTLLAPLYLCSLGFLVPKLGVPGRPAGGIDVLAQLPGYRTNLSISKLKQVIAECGFAHFLAGEGFAPLDSKLFSFRQMTGGQNIPPLTSASLLAKKLASGVRTVGIDVRVAPHGNFGCTYDDARHACGPLLQAGRHAGLNVVCILTDARFPYQPFIGRGEALVALKHIFSGQATESLASHNGLCRLMAHHVAGLQDPSRLRVTDTDIETVFYAHISAQGSSVDAFNRTVDATLAGHRHELIAKHPGHLLVDLDTLRKLFQHINVRRLSDVLHFPDEIGVILHARPGEYIERGTLLATVRASNNVWETHYPLLYSVIRSVDILAATPAAIEVVYG